MSGCYALMARTWGREESFWGSVLNASPWRYAILLLAVLVPWRVPTPLRWEGGKA